ncbi:hypothetical protein ABH920_001241 [Catenulispora sp. EB89]|uniref:hypothetical protein n=1 Tax=Catenulispora sp. EB89 TaxID=3156257 RepID=UPI003511022D
MSGTHGVQRVQRVRQVLDRTVRVRPVRQPVADRLAGPRAERIGGLHHGGRRRRRTRLGRRAAEQPEPGQQPGPADRDDRGEQRGTAHRPRLGGLPAALLPVERLPVGATA